MKTSSAWSPNIATIARTREKGGNQNGGGGESGATKKKKTATQGIRFLVRTAQNESENTPLEEKKGPKKAWV